MDKKEIFIKEWLKNKENFKSFMVKYFIIVGLFLTLIESFKPKNQEKFMNIYNMFLFIIVLFISIYIMISANEYRIGEIEINNFYINRKKNLVIKRKLMIRFCTKLSIFAEILIVIRDIYLHSYKFFININWFLENIIRILAFLAIFIFLFKIITIINTTYLAHKISSIIIVFLTYFIVTASIFGIYNKNINFIIVILLLSVLFLIGLFILENKISKTIDERDYVFVKVNNV